MGKLFKRKDDYSEETLRDVKKLLDASRKIGMDVIAIPNIKTIICYYSGYPFVEINDNDWKWKGFKSYADKHFNDVSDEIKDIIRGDKPVTVCQVLFEIILCNKKWHNNKAEKCENFSA